MLYEIQNARQVEGEGFRRWFTDEYFDLIVWYNDNDRRPIGFQLCYDKAGRERALTWTVEHGFQHDRIDSGETPGHFKMTPIIIADGAFNPHPVAERFRQACTSIDSAIASFVLDRIAGYPAAGAPEDNS
jgi:hypothetical protein